MNITIVIPSYNPDEKLIEVVSSILAGGFSDIICVNDGSRSECTHFFDQVAGYPGVELLTHPVNRGKGAALKTAFTHILENREKNAVITVDGDNQHKLADIRTIAQALEQQEALILGVRTFDGDNVPARSSIGNKMTSRLFSMFCGLEICDTQTGLRGIPHRYLADFLKLSGDRFEYETNMLLATRRLGIPIVQLPIATVYIEENKSSHFRPVVDSLKILRLMAKFCVSSLLCTAIDILGYKLIHAMLNMMTLSQRVLFSTVCARLVSSIINYLINKNTIFHSKASSKRSVLRYYLLAGGMMLCSYAGVFALSRAFGHSVWFKVAVDSVLFAASFRIQQRWVFHD